MLRTCGVSPSSNSLTPSSYSHAVRPITTPSIRLLFRILITAGLVILNHYLWFRHFSAPPPHSSYNPYARDPSIPTFTEIASYFGLCVWLVPFALFVSLSAGENVLPSMGSEYATGEGSSFISPGKEPGADAYGSGVGGVGGGSGGRRRGRSGTNAGMAKAMVNGVREWVGETGEVMGFWKGERTRPTF